MFSEISYFLHHDYYAGFYIAIPLLIILWITLAFGKLKILAITKLGFSKAEKILIQKESAKNGSFDDITRLPADRFHTK